MQENVYQIAGTVNVPENKKAEMNQYVLEILYRCGIRMTEEVELDGKQVTVVRRASPDEDGIVEFNYSIFEKRVRESATYDTKTCVLTAPDRGYGKFGNAMSLIMVLEEAYSEGSCYFMIKGKPCTCLPHYLKWINSLLHTRIPLNSRTDMWKMYQFFRRSKEYAPLTGRELFNSFPADYTKPELYEMALMCVIDHTEIIFSDENACYTRERISEYTHIQMKEYLTQIMLELVRSNKAGELGAYLSELLDLDLDERKKLAEREDILGTIAELSLYLHPANIVHVYATAQKKDFWETWESLGVTGYAETLCEREWLDCNINTDEREYPIYLYLGRSTEDEFIEFYDGEEMLFSNRMLRQMEEWKKRFESASPDPDMQMEPYLASLISDLNEEWNCRLTDQEFVREFLGNKESEEHKKALVVLREFMDEDLKYFPELTRWQAVNWVIKDNREEFESVAVSAYQSLLMNHKMRKEILGF